jgi:YfiH family protein
MFRPKSVGGATFFVFSELEETPGFVHGFTTRQTDLAGKDACAAGEVASSKGLFLKALGIGPDSVVLLKQVHSDRVVTFGAGTPIKREQADGILLPDPGRFAVIKTADCLPIIALYPKGRQVCALHAGWRGTRDQIARKGLGFFLKETSARPEDVIVALGPCIRRCCYEVGPEVIEEFREKGHDLARITDGARLDLVEANWAQVENLGVSHVLDSGMCTACRTDLFYSYRLEGLAERSWALAGFRE